MKIIQFLILFTFSSTGAMLRFSGNIPPEVKSDYLEQQFQRILHTLDSTRAQSHVVPVHILFLDRVTQRNLGIRLPEWGGGGAIGTDTVVIPTDKNPAFHSRNLNKIIVHELVHIAISRLFGSIRVPRWFHEGTAMVLSGELSFDEQAILSCAIITRNLIPLDSIEFLNRFSQSKARLAYSQSHAVLAFLIDTYGIELIPELIIASRKTRKFEDACIHTFGLSTKEIEVQFVRYLQKRYPLLIVGFSFSLFWFLVLALSIIAWFIIYVRKIRKLDQMESEESLQDEQDAGNELADAPPIDQ